jgi:type IV pilus assembly protein PilB
MSSDRLRLGETLVEAGVISQEDLDQALTTQKERQLRLGTILLQEGYVTESQLVQALSLKLSIPWVSLWRVDIPDELLELVPVNVAEEFFLMPIYIRTTGSGERALYVAMNDPTDDDALRFVQAAAGIPVKPMIAGPSDIASAIRFYYYGEDVDERFSSSPPPPGGGIPPAPTGKGAVPPPPPKPRTTGPSKPPPTPPTPKAAKKDEPAEEEEIEALSDEDLELEPEEEAAEAATEETAREEPQAEQEAEADEAAVDDRATQPAAESDEDAVARDNEADEVFADKTSAQREAERRLFGVGHSKPKRAFSLTLLDGTTLSFGPSKAKKPDLPTPETLSKDDLLAGLKAAAQGTPLDDFLPSEHWEAYVGAMLNILFRKHLVLFDELMEELKALKED